MHPALARHGYRWLAAATRAVSSSCQLAASIPLVSQAAVLSWREGSRRGRGRRPGDSLWGAPHTRQEGRHRRPGAGRRHSKEPAWEWWAQRGRRGVRSNGRAGGWSAASTRAARQRPHGNAAPASREGHAHEGCTMCRAYAALCHCRALEHVLYQPLLAALPHLVSRLVGRRLGAHVSACGKGRGRGKSVRAGPWKGLECSSSWCQAIVTVGQVLAEAAATAQRAAQPHQTVCDAANSRQCAARKRLTCCVWRSVFQRKMRPTLGVRLGHGRRVLARLQQATQASR